MMGFLQKLFGRMPGTDDHGAETSGKAAVHDHDHDHDHSDPEHSHDESAPDETDA
jgi:hypothetical protein